jgi:preprotein translocase subunit SecF
MKFNLIYRFKRLLTNTVSSLLVVTLLFQLALSGFADRAIAADFNSSLLLTINSEKMADQVQGQLDLEQKGTTDRKNTQYGAATKGTQKIDPDRSSQDVDLVKPTVAHTNKDMSNKLNETEKLGKGAGIKAAEKGGDLLDNVKNLFDKK